MAKGKLKPKDEQLIIKNYQALKKELDPKYLLDYLFQNNVVSRDELERINKATSRLEGIDILLAIVLDSGPAEAFNIFVQSLEEHYPHIVKLLRHEENMEKPPPKGQLPEYAMRIIPKVTQPDSGEMCTYMVMNLGQRKEINPKDIVAKMTEDLNVLKCNYMPDTLPRSFKQQFPVGQLKEEFQEIDLLLIGKTGNGKSALGNALLQKKAFLSSASLDSVTVDVTADSNEVNGVQLTVVDVPGVSDTRKDEEQSIEDLLDCISKAMVLRPHGYHALLLVGKYGSRFTKEESDTVTCLKKIFGKKFFSKFCIIVMTHGDQFEFSGCVKFSDWIAKQKCEIFRELLRECNNRIILFDNRTLHKAKQECQLKELFKLIKTIKMQNCRYSIDHFSTAQHSRNILLVETKYDIYSDTTMRKANFIFGRYQKLLKTILPTERIPFLEELSNDAKELLHTVTNLDRGTQVLQNLLDNVQSLSNSIDDDIRVTDKIAEEKKKIIDNFEKKIFDLKQQIEEQDKQKLCKQSSMTADDYVMIQKSLKVHQAEIQKEYDEIQRRHEMLHQKLAQNLNVVHNELTDVIQPKKDEKARINVFQMLKKKLIRRKDEKYEGKI